MAKTVKTLKMEITGSQKIRELIKHLDIAGLSIHDLAKKVIGYTENLQANRFALVQQLDEFTRLNVSMEKQKNQWKLDTISLQENTAAKKANAEATRQLKNAQEQGRLVTQFTEGNVTGPQISKSIPEEQFGLARANAALRSFVEANRIAAAQVKVVWDSIKLGYIATEGSDMDLKLQKLVYDVQQAQTQMGESVHAEALKENALYDKKAEHHAQTVDKMYKDGVAAVLKENEQRRKLLADRMSEEERAQRERAAIYDRMRKDELEKQKEAVRLQLEEQKKLQQQQAIQQGGLIGASLFGRVDFSKATIDQRLSVINAIEGIKQYAIQHRISLEQVNAMWANVANGNIKQYDRALSGLQTQIYGVQQQTKNFGVQAAKTGQSFLLSWQSVFRIVTARAFSAAFFRITAGMREAITTAKELSLRIAEIRTISQTAQLTTGEWQQGLVKLSNAFGLDVLDQAEGAYQAISNQVVKGAEAFTFMAEANKFAIATVSTTEQSVNLLSSVINAYGYSVKDAEYISSVLFKTIELGRVRSEEMASTFGNIAVLASQVGITFEELAAAVSTLTIQGIKYNMAATQLRGIFQKLIQPTKAMKAFFSDIGVESGEAAIRTYGFSGVLQLMRKHTGGNASEMVKLISRIRGISGALGLTNDNVKRFKDNLKANEEALASYRIAVEESMQATGRTVQIEMTRIKNVFTTTFGDAILQKIAEVSKSVGGVDKVIKAVAETISGLAYNSVTKVAAALSATTAIVIALSRVIRTHNPYIMLAEAALVAGGALAAYIHKIIDAKEALEDLNQERTRAAGDVARKEVDQLTKGYKDAFDERIRIALQANALLTGLENKRIRGYTADIERYSKIVKAATDDTVKYIDKSVTGLEKILDKSKSAVDKLKGSIKDSITDQLSKEFEYSLEKLVPKDLVDELQKEIGRLQARAKVSIEIGDTDDAEEQFKESVKLHDRITEVVREAVAKRKELEKRTTEAYKKHGEALKALNEQYKQVPDKTKSSEYLQAQAAINQAHKETLDKIAQEYIGIQGIGKSENAITASILQRRRLIIEINELRQKGMDAELKKIEESQKKLAYYEDLREKLKETGEVTKGFKLEDALSIADSAERVKAITDYVTALNRQKGIRQELGILTNEENIAISESIDKFNKIAEATKKLAELKTTEQQVLEAQQQVTEEFEKQNAALTENNVEYKKTQDRIRRTSEELEQYFKSYENLPKDMGPLLAGQGEDISEQLHRLSVALRVSKELQDKISPTDLKSNVELIKQMYDSAIKASKETSYPILAEEFKRQAEVIGTLYQQARELVRESPVIQAMADYKAAMESYRATTATEMANYEKIIEEATKSTTANVEKSGEKIELVFDKTKSFVIALEEFSNRLMALTERWTFAAQEVAPQLQARGGMMQAHGSDRIPALLSPGEFVVNAKSSRKFFSQLLTMNSGSVPRFERGGGVTNIGDVNVSLHSTGSESVDIVRIGNGLRRAIRDGRVKL